MMLNRSIIKAGWFSLITCLVLTMTGCNLNKMTLTPKKPLSADQSLVRKVIHAQPDWNFMEIRVTGKADQDGDRVSFMGTIRMERNRQLYVSMRSPIGIEVAKLYATPDSIWISSKMMGIKERLDWRQAHIKSGYPVDFQALQGILAQSLFTSSGDLPEQLTEQLEIKRNGESIHLVTSGEEDQSGAMFRYLTDFKIRETGTGVESSNIRDINGQWIIDVFFSYGRDGVIRKIDMKGLDTDSRFTLDMTVVKRDFLTSLEINFQKF